MTIHRNANFNIIVGSKSLNIMDTNINGFTVSRVHSGEGGGIDLPPMPNSGP